MDFIILTGKYMALHQIPTPNLEGWVDDPISFEYIEYASKNIQQSLINSYIEYAFKSGKIDLAFNTAKKYNISVKKHKIQKWTNFILNNGIMSRNEFYSLDMNIIKKLDQHNIYIKKEKLIFYSLEKQKANFEEIKDFFNYCEVCLTKDHLTKIGDRILNEKDLMTFLDFYGFYQTFWNKYYDIKRREDVIVMNSWLSRIFNCWRE